MGSIEREHHLRKQIGGLAMLAAPVFGLVGIAVAPALDSNEREWLDNIAEATNRAWFGQIMLVLSLGFAVFAVLALVHMLRERESTYGDVGGALAVFGIVLAAIYSGAVGMTIEVNNSLVGTGYAAEIVKDAADNPIAITGLVGLVAFGVGLLVLAVGLYRAQVVPVMTSLGIGLFAVGLVIGYQVLSTPLVIASFVVLTVALLPVGWHVMRETDEAWEHAPRVHGFRMQTT